jgi:hypothetical protein
VFTEEEEEEEEDDEEEKKTIKSFVVSRKTFARAATIFRYLFLQNNKCPSVQSISTLDL